jgi:hypothetical protein
MRESKLFHPIKDFCLQKKLKLWSEVANLATRNTKVVDAVIQFDNHYMALELKTTLNLVVLGQAYNNLKYFNASVVVVPKRQHDTDVGRDFAYMIMKEKGIGLIELYNKDDNYQFPVNDPFVIEPQYKPRPILGKNNVTTWLRDEQRSYIAGERNNYYSDKQKAIKQIYDYLLVANVATIDDLLQIVKWYFKTSRILFENVKQSKKFDIFHLDNKTFVKINEDNK